jgi:hypothetical protein
MPYTQAMLYFECRKGWYYGGQIDLSGCFPKRRPTRDV